MELIEIFEANRLKEYGLICRWIAEANTTELALIIDEIRCCHDNLMVWNEGTKCLDKVESLSINDQCVQLNL